MKYIFIVTLLSVLTAAQGNKDEDKIPTVEDIINEKVNSVSKSLSATSETLKSFSDFLAPENLENKANEYLPPAVSEYYNSLTEDINPELKELYRKNLDSLIPDEIIDAVAKSLKKTSDDLAKNSESGNSNSNSN